MKAICVVIFVACLIVFARARTRFFDRSGGGDAGRVILARVGTLAGVVLPVNAVYPVGLIAAPLYGLGFALFVASMLLFAFATRAHGDRRPGIAYSVRAPDFLVCRGPYRYVRHPIYSAYMLCWVGACMIGPTIVAFLLVGAMIYLYYLTVKFEEGVIEASDLAEEYRLYKMKAGMFLPRFPSSGAH